MYNHLISTRNYLKENPRSLFKKFYLIPFVPFVLIIALINRLKTENAKVYLLNMELNPVEVMTTDFEVLNYSNIDSVIEIAKERQVENNFSDENYFRKVNDRIQSGDFLFCLKNEGKIVSCLFLSEETANLEQVNYIIKLPELTFAIYDVYTFKEFRGKGYYEKLFNSACNHEYKKGFNLCYLWLMKHNKSSIIVHNKIGMKNVVKEFIYTQKYGFRKTKCIDVNYDSLALLNNS